VIIYYYITLLFIGHLPKYNHGIFSLWLYFFQLNSCKNTVFSSTVYFDDKEMYKIVLSFSNSSEKWHWGERERERAHPIRWIIASHSYIIIIYHVPTSISI